MLTAEQANANFTSTKCSTINGPLTICARLATGGDVLLSFFIIFYFSSADINYNFLRSAPPLWRTRAD